MKQSKLIVDTVRDFFFAKFKELGEVDLTLNDKGGWLYIIIDNRLYDVAIRINNDELAIKCEVWGYDKLHRICEGLLWRKTSSFDLRDPESLEEAVKWCEVIAN